MLVKKRALINVVNAFLVIGFIATVGCSSSRDHMRILCFVPAEENSLLTRLQALSASENWHITHAHDPAVMAEDSLINYSAVVLWGDMADTLNHRQQRDLERYILAGGGVIGVALHTKYQYKWPWLERLLAANSAGAHKKSPIARLTATASDSVRQSSYGRGHVILLSEHQFQSASTLSKAMQKAIGKNLWPAYHTVSLDRVPAATGFSEEILATNLNEPIELEVLPTGDVLFIERGGNVKYYHQATRATRTIALINVDNSQSNGLNGMALDPRFRQNHWVYFSYTPANDPFHQHISRFFLAEDSLIMASEKIIMKVPVNAKHGGHAENALEFDKHGNLYIGFGDFTHDPSGYAAIDEREGHARHDAQRTAANSKDYRGKILRIHPESNGGYSIPDGNLFPKDGSQGHPEIYVMGCRNPYRFSIDQHNDFLYFGDIGPDAGMDGLQGHRGYDEVNRAATAGFYGWPYFTANNKPYPDYNFATGETGAFFNPEAPYNDSPNNTGIRELPPARPALIWYPYDITYEFPYMGKGGMNIMAGPVYHYNDFPGSPNRLPAYYDDKLIIYDWVRNWMLAVTFDAQYDLLSVEPFLEFTTLSKPVDMTFGPDGSLYVLEYGAMGYAANKDAKIRRITFPTGNRPPMANIAADKTEGAVPLSVNFSGAGSTDYDRDDQLHYTWVIEEQEFSGDTLSYVFERPGIYEPILRVTDQAGAIAEARVEIKAGNAPPAITIHTTGNQSFYWGTDTLQYKINVEDREDGSLASGQILPSDVNVSFTYNPALHTETPVGFHQANDIAEGAALVDASGCMSCHDLDVQSVGPSYTAVANRYEESNDTYAWLSKKIREGGKGKWPGNLSMPAHPYLTEEETRQMIAYILSLEAGGNRAQQLSTTGRLITNQHQSGAYGDYVLTVTYKDKGASSISPIRREEKLVLRYPELNAAHCDHYEGALIRAGTSVWIRENEALLRFNSIDLTNIGTIGLKLKSRASGKVSIRIDASDGPEIGTAPIAKNDATWTLISPILKTSGVHDLYFVFTSTDDADIQKMRYLMMVDQVLFKKEQPVNP